MQIVYRCTLLLLALAIWSLTTLQMLSDLSYFLKTGLYNGGPLFYTPRWPSLLTTMAGGALITLAATAKHTRLRALAGVVAMGLAGATAALLAIYCWIYADLIAAKLFGAQLNRTVVMASAFELAVLTIMYLLASTLLTLKRSSWPLYAVVATLSASGLAKTVLLAAAPRIPVLGLAHLTCNGPRL